MTGDAAAKAWPCGGRQGMALWRPTSVAVAADERGRMAADERGGLAAADGR
jgi:hypothetical protein